MIVIIPSSWDRIKVNGRDLSDITAKEAHELFQCTDEKLTLEVLRKKQIVAPAETLDASTQTEMEWSKGPAQGKGELEVSSCERLLESLYQELLLPEANSSDDEEYVPSLPHDVENAEELLCQDSGHTLYQEDDLNYRYTDPGSINVSPILTESEEDGEKPTVNPANLQDWDSGLGFTDGSIPVDDHSGHNTETEDLCTHAEGKPDPGDCSRMAGSYLDYVDFSTSDDQSDSGFCSISPEEYLRFQKVLESKCRQYQLRESNRQVQRIRQSPRLQGEERHGHLNDEVLDRSAWCPRLPTLEEHPEVTVSLPCLKNEELPFSASMEPCPTKIMSREFEKHMLEKPKVSEQSPTTCIPSGEDQGTANRALRRRSYLNCLQGDFLAEWLELPVCLPNESSWIDDGRCDNIDQKVQMQCEKAPVSSKKQNKNQLLKERAIRLREERSGTTTDDDAQSEVKMGRHWSKAERRQHMLVAREQKQRKELLLQNKMENLMRYGRTGQDKGNRNEQNIIELSNKKLMRKRSKKVLDNWMTIQELLSHGTKSMGGTTTYSPLLSVTTV